MLRIKIAEALGIEAFDEEVFLEWVEQVEVLKDAPLKIFLKNGEVVEKTWKRRARYARCGNEAYKAD